MRTGGDETKKKILEAAEQLFSEKGFDGASVGMIADAVGINKGLIYYHFKNKDDILVSLFAAVIEELSEHLKNSPVPHDGAADGPTVKDKVRQELRFLEKRKRILSVMLMEAFKRDDRENFLLKCAEMSMKQEDEYFANSRLHKLAGSSSEQEYLVFEFFTGFIPVITFVAMKDKWTRYYNCDGDELLERFLDSFERAHLTAYLRKPGP
jgi:AcrR family transcriptional regulator